jgi:hypothetical protein
MSGKRLSFSVTAHRNYIAVSQIEPQVLSETLPRFVEMGSFPSSK